MSSIQKFIDMKVDEGSPVHCERLGLDNLPVYKENTTINVYAISKHSKLNVDVDLISLMHSEVRSSDSAGNLETLVSPAQRIKDLQEQLGKGNWKTHEAKTNDFILSNITPMYKNEEEFTEAQGKISNNFYMVYQTGDYENIICNYDNGDRTYTQYHLNGVIARVVLYYSDGKTQKIIMNYYECFQPDRIEQVTKTTGTFQNKSMDSLDKERLKTVVGNIRRCFPRNDEQQYY
jgi:hypothetical protein